ncbi:hypothetical protein NOGI109294_06505 [Nocardiopsis gilva]
MGCFGGTPGAIIDVETNSASHLRAHSRSGQRHESGDAGAVAEPASAVGEPRSVTTSTTSTFAPTAGVATGLAARTPGTTG